VAINATILLACRTTSRFMIGVSLRGVPCC
jgi:hypothetical protein